MKGRFDEPILSLPFWITENDICKRNHDYTDADASENSHLCSVGAQKLSARLDSIAHMILNP